MSEQAQQRALADLCAINVDHDWWDFVYEDAERIGLKLTSFSEHDANGELTMSVSAVCSRIMKNHGKNTNTYETAVWYRNGKRKGKRVSKDDFLYALLDNYRIMLSETYDDLTSDEQVAETIRANEYEFFASGAMCTLPQITPRADTFPRAGIITTQR